MSTASLEVRLQYLETREEANTRDIIRLKTENAELQNKVVELTSTISALKRENGQTVERFMEAETKIKKVEKDLKIVSGLGESIEEVETKFKKIERELKIVSGFQERGEETETRLNVLENNMKTVFGFRESIVEAKNKFKAIECDLQTVFGFRENIEGQLSSLESNMIVVKDTEDRLNSLETVINSVRQDVASCKRPDDPDRSEEITCGGDAQSVVTDRLQKVEIDIKSSEKNLEKRLTKVEMDVRNTRQESTNIRQSVTDKLKLTERQAEETQKIVTELMQVRDSIYKSMTCVSLVPKHKPKTGERVKLVRCDVVHTNGGYFNVNSCRFQPIVGGYYAVDVRFCQEGDGKILLFYNCMGQTQALYIGATFDHNDVVSTTQVVRLNKGDELWLEMERNEGNANLLWCYLSAWLISPSEL